MQIFCVIPMHIEQYGLTFINSTFFECSRAPQLRALNGSLTQHLH